MATMITAECINCGACEPECPNTAIYQGGVDWQAMDGSTHPAISADLFYIVPEKCTECVGFHDAEACATVCPVDACVPNPQIPETHEVLLERARVLHPETTIPDDAPSRFKSGGASEPAAAAAAPAAAAPKAAPVAAAPVATVVVEETGGMAIPPPEDWEVPITCFRCEGEYSVPYPSYRAGTVFRCPHCNGSLVPTLSMVRGVREALEQFHAKWAAAFEGFRERRQRELDTFEEKQRRELTAFEDRLRGIATRERAPGAPQKRRGFFAF